MQNSIPNHYIKDEETSSTEMETTSCPKSPFYDDLAYNLEPIDLTSEAQPYAEHETKYISDDSKVMICQICKTNLITFHP